MTKSKDEIDEHVPELRTDCSEINKVFDRGYRQGFQSGFEEGFGNAKKMFNLSLFLIGGLVVLAFAYGLIGCP